MWRVEASSALLSESSLLSWSNKSTTKQSVLMFQTLVLKSYILDFKPKLKKKMRYWLCILKKLHTFTIDLFGNRLSFCFLTLVLLLHFLDDKNPCHLPEAPGPCRGLVTRYFFDSESQQCKHFYYGGCFGNANNFRRMEACQAKCQNPGGSSSFTANSNKHCKLSPQPQIR